MRKTYPDISIGFFQHIPFPSFESFRLIPWRKEILLGMLGADLIGFHTYDDTRHFLSSVSRLVGEGNSEGQIEYGNRLIMVDSFPMGIDYEKYRNSAADPDTLSREARYRTSLGDRKIILSIDRLDYTKGIPLRLKAYELFLTKYPEFKDKVSLLMVVVPSRVMVEKYKQLKEEVDLLVGKINGDFNRVDWTPIHYFYRSLPLPAISAFYRLADVAMITPLRDGMNLVCKEFVASQLDKKGVLILSEMAGAAKELSDAILINPFDVNEIAESIYRALTMPEDEQEKHLSIMQKSLKRYNVFHWANLFITRLEFVKKKQKELVTKLIDKPILDSLLKSYRNSKSRLIFLDYDGTLVPFQSNPNEAKPDKRLYDIINSLCEDEHNRVVIISGREKKFLNKWFKGINLDIIAEHGVWLKQFDGNWETLTKLDNLWKDEIRPVVEFYVDRTPGSFIEEKDYSMVWHFRKVETGLGQLRSRELASQLHYLARDRNLKVYQGNMVVEIKSTEVDKGTAAQLWIKKLKPDFIIAIGDDWTDEDTFKVIPATGYTVKVGGGISQAKYSVQDYMDVRDLLTTMSGN